MIPKELRNKITEVVRKNGVIVINPTMEFLMNSKKNSVDLCLDGFPPDKEKEVNEFIKSLKNSN